MGLWVVRKGRMGLWVVRKGRMVLDKVILLLWSMVDNLLDLNTFGVKTQGWWGELRR